MSDAKLGKLERVDLREAWKNEAEHFTPWLARPENMQLLGETLGMELELVGQEKQVGPFRADILCKDLSDGSWVLVENQLERTDHSHLGQILTYAAGLEAATVIWIAREFTDEHRATLDWLNEITDDKFSFLGVEVQLWRIGNSPIAPKFDIISKPNDWSRELRSSASRAAMTPHRQLQLEYWTKFTEFMADSKLKCGKARPKNSIEHPMGSAALKLYSVASMFTQGISGEAPELRVELGVVSDDRDSTFSWLEQRKPDIESRLGGGLVWDTESYKGRYYRIYLAKKYDMRDRDAWSEQFAWLRQQAERFYDVFVPLIKEYEETSE